jgi:ribosome biogenesis GTPase A
MQMSVVVQNGKDLVPTRKKQHAAGEREKVRKQFRENFKTTSVSIELKTEKQVGDLDRRFFFLSNSITDSNQ